MWHPHLRLTHSFTVCTLIAIISATNNLNMNTGNKSSQCLDALFMAVIFLAAILENLNPLVYLLMPEGHLKETAFLQMTKNLSLFDQNMYLVLIYCGSVCSLFLYAAGLLGVFWRHRLLLLSFLLFNIVTALFELAYEEPFLLNIALAVCSMLYSLYCLPEEYFEESAYLLPKYTK